MSVTEKLISGASITPTHQTQEDPSPSIEEVVNKIVECSKQEYISLYEEEYATYFDENEQRKKITTLEKAFRQKTLPANWDAYAPAGGIKLSIDPQDIDTYVQEKFSALRKSGLLLRRSEFEQKYDPKKFRKPGKNQNQDLTRLWGAEYLREKLADRDDYCVPRFFLVVNDDAKILPVTIAKGTKSIVIRDCETEVGEIVAENIEDSVANCNKEAHGWMLSLGYIDYADSGNIRQNKKDGKFYVVDTEWKSLDGVINLMDQTLSDLDPSLKKLRRYANERFDALHSDEWKMTLDVKLDTTKN